MQFSRIALLLAVLASSSVMSHVLTERQTDCSTYGDYPEYIGPCSDTGKYDKRNWYKIFKTIINRLFDLSPDCGVNRTNCYAKYQDCVSYPSEFTKK